ncbi:hypothetical protein L581_3677 [Serratia fonticola AU-AP2C]|nr:hypothetical protein L581_3677 [Serratia fonticola AU-AP2C]
MISDAAPIVIGKLVPDVAPLNVKFEAALVGMMVTELILPAPVVSN